MLRISKKIFALVIILSSLFVYIGSANASIFDSLNLDFSESKAIERIKGAFSDNDESSSTSGGFLGSPNLKLFNREDFSKDDIIPILKAVSVVVINIFLVVIDVIAQILKVLLEFIVDR